jgi:hypothetical protein
MRPILLILILGIVALIAAVATGLVDIRGVRGGKVPDVDRTANGVVAKGGQAPAFDIETGSVAVGTRQANVVVPVPEVRVKPAPEANPPANAVQQNQAATTNTAM